MARGEGAGCAVGGCAGLSLMGLLVTVVALGFIASRALDGLTLGVGTTSVGRSSLHLDVTVTPAADLVDGSTVRVQSTAFRHGTLVGIAVCLQEADVLHKGVKACDTISGYRFLVPDSGRLDVPFRVPRIITVDNLPFDCASQAGRCVVVAADDRERNRSGGQPISFRAGLPAVPITVSGPRPHTDHLPIGGSPSGRLAPMTRVTVIAGGFQPGEPLVAGTCDPSFGSQGVSACEPEGGSSDALLALLGPGVVKAPFHADADGRFIGRVTVRRTVHASFDPTSVTDCTAQAGTCSIVVAATADPRRSAVLPYEIAAR